MMIALGIAIILLGLLFKAGVPSAVIGPALALGFGLILVKVLS